MYDPLNVAERPYYVDYAKSLGRDEKSRSFTSPEGVILDAPFVAGRRASGASDTGILPGEQYNISKRLIGRSFETVPPSEMRKDVGRWIRVAGPDGPQYHIKVRDALLELWLAPSRD